MASAFEVKKLISAHEDLHQGDPDPERERVREAQLPGFWRTLYPWPESREQ